MVDAEIPVLNPAGIQEVLDFGIYGWALSRYAGTWVSMIALAETMDASATVEVHPHRVPIVKPFGFPLPKDGLNIRSATIRRRRKNGCASTRFPPSSPSRTPTFSIAW